MGEEVTRIPVVTPLGGPDNAINKAHGRNTLLSSLQSQGNCLIFTSLSHKYPDFNKWKEKEVIQYTDLSEDIYVPEMSVLVLNSDFCVYFTCSSLYYLGCCLSTETKPAYPCQM